MKKKQVMLIVPRLVQGGQEKVCLTTARQLRDEYDVHLVIFSDKDMFYDASDLDVINIRVEASEKRLNKVHNTLERARKIRKLKKNLNIDIAYSFGPSANLPNALSKGHEKVLVGVRDYPQIAENPQTKLMYEHTDCVVSCTRIMDDAIRKNFKVRSSAVLNNPVDGERIRRLSAEECPKEIVEFTERPGKTIVSMGRIADQKGFWHLLKAFSLVRKETDAKLLIIGVGDASEYEQLARDLGVAEDVLFTGGLKNPFPVLKKCDIYALSSLSEGFPNALLEAMFMGLAVVSVNCKTGPAEMLCEDYTKASDERAVYYGEYGILTPVVRAERDMNAGNIEKEDEILAAELLKLVQDDELREKYARAALERSGVYSLEAYTGNLKELIGKFV